MIPTHSDANPVLIPSDFFWLGLSAVAYYLGWKKLAVVNGVVVAAGITIRQAAIAKAQVTGNQDLVNMSLNGYRQLVQIPSLGRLVSVPGLGARHYR